MRSSRPSLAPSVSASDTVESPDRECDAPDIGLIVLPRRALGESPFTKTSLPCSSTVVEIWARTGVDSANTAPATSTTATGMQLLFIVLLFATRAFGRLATNLLHASGKAEHFASCRKRKTHIRRRRRLLRRKHLARQQL